MSNKPRQRSANPYGDWCSAYYEEAHRLTHGLLDEHSCTEQAGELYYSSKDRDPVRLARQHYGPPPVEGFPRAVWATKPDVAPPVAAIPPDEGYTLYWESPDKQRSIALGTYPSFAEAEAASFEEFPLLLDVLTDDDLDRIQPGELENFVIKPPSA